MIVTVTANPCIDLTLTVDELAVGEVNRASSTTRYPAGKGINVSRVLALNDVPTVALLPADDLGGQWLIRALAREGVETISSPLADEVRHNITVANSDGVTTTINEPGPQVTAAEREALLAEITAVLVTRPAWLVASGSLPRGLDSSFYVALGEEAKEHNVRFACDTSGTALTHIAESGRADLLKPNWEELQALAGRALETVDDVVHVCRSYLLPGAEILVSLGEFGALLVSDDHVAWAGHEALVPVSTVGAGDSSLAGYVAADVRATNQRLDPADARHARLKTAVSWGAAAVLLPGTALPGPQDLSPDKVHVVDNPNPSTRIENLGA